MSDVVWVELFGIAGTLSGLVVGFVLGAWAAAGGE